MNRRELLQTLAALGMTPLTPKPVFTFECEGRAVKWYVNGLTDLDDGCSPGRIGYSFTHVDSGLLVSASWRFGDELWAALDPTSFRFRSTHHASADKTLPDRTVVRLTDCKPRDNICCTVNGILYRLTSVRHEWGGIPMEKSWTRRVHLHLTVRL